jgi:hypothetical protein
VVVGFEEVAEFVLCDDLLEVAGDELESGLCVQIIASESVFVGVGVDLRVEGRRPCPSQQTHGVTVGAAPLSAELSHL